MKNYLHKIVVLITVTLLLWSCSTKNKPVFEQFQPISTKGWSQNKEFFFSAMIDRDSIPYDILISLRNNNRYPYKNLWLIVIEEPPIGTITTDTIELQLADAFGKWYGHGISLFELHHSLYSKRKFKSKGRYTFSLQQAMRDSSLIGIEEIGIRIIPSQKQ